MPAIRIGEFAVDRIADYEGPFFAPADFFPDFDPAVVSENAELLGPRLIEPGTGKLMFSFHSFVVRTGRHTILIDSCIGNDKDRPSRPQFHRMRGPFIDDLARLGIRPEEVDYVMCTHLHWDHVGWNTRLQNGSWVPTFPNAKYVMAKTEYDHWQDFHASGADSPHALAFEDSILPVVKTGQALLVGDDYALDDGLWFEAYPGHTPGNVVIHARSGGASGVFIGDVLHHPLQCIKPAWSTMACTDPALSRVSRTRLIEEHADSGALILPAHFPAPTVGHIRPHQSAFRFDFAS
ncbi:MAG: MBL fold metallo-hydrolase [Alphaproteobacteria bacterium]|nr:MBL fold metallo-hydrolase [Alphaproteobacteria bacterium]